jgi:hypothetical protein
MRDIDIVETSNRVQAAIARLGHRITGASVRSDSSAYVASCCHTVRIDITQDGFVDEFSKQVPRVLTLAIAEEDSVPVPDGLGLTNDMVLTHIQRELQWQLSADYLRWVGQGRLLSAADFALMTADLPGPITARPTRLASSAADVKVANHAAATQACAADLADLRRFFIEADTNPQAITEAMQDETGPEQLSAQQRLSAWLLTYAVMLFAFPVGLFLFLMTVLKGENPRLASQTAALTGTFLSFQTFGTTAQAMDAVQSVLF